MNLFSLNEIKQLLAEAGTSPKKGYGQNFLINPAVPERIAAAAADSLDSGILEIGPGIGTLTQSLASRYAKVAAVEIDASLIPVLQRTLADYNNVAVVNADFMKLDMRALLRENFPDGMPVSVCANLPYYITTPIIMRLLEDGADGAKPMFDNITVMVQSEVADRFTAAPGNADYGAITAAIAYYGQCRRLFTVTSGNFYPAPKVDSAVIAIELYREPKYPVRDPALMMRVIAASFGQRRKTLVNALCAGFPRLSKSDAAAVLESLGHRTDIRGEKLSTADFAALTDALEPYISDKKTEGAL